MKTNTDEPRKELLPGVVTHPADIPARAVYSMGLDPLYGEEFDILGLIPACTKYTAAGNLWTCPTYYARSTFDGGCIVAPVRHFTATE